MLPCSFIFNRRHKITGFSTIEFLAAVSLGSYGNGFSTAALIAYLSANIAESASPYQRYFGCEELLSQARTSTCLLASGPSMRPFAFELVEVS